jgi:hydrogenase maturation protease
MVQLKKAPEEGWKEKFASLKKTESLVFVGVGKRNHGDDGAGIELALKLREQGVRNVWLEDEIEEKNSLWESNPNCTLIFLDAVDFGENPGKIALFPLQHVFWNSLLSHKLMPFIPGPLNYHQLKKSFVLGIQPESIGEGESISRAIRMAMKKILYEIRN